MATPQAIPELPGGQLRAPPSPLARAASAQPKPSVALIPPPPLRRIRSAPEERCEAAAKQVFTDLLLERLTSAIAEPVEGEVEAQAPAVECAFGADPPPRETASLRPGRCAVCFEDTETRQLCWNSSCADRFCNDCIAGFAKEAVNKALYTVPWLKCPGCSGRIPSSSWVDTCRSAKDTYSSNAEALLTFRCQECHEVGSLLKEHCSHDLVSKLGEETATKLKQAWPDFANAVSPPEVLLDMLSEQHRDVVAESIVDIERRTCFILAQLRRNSFILTPCCDEPFCFKCKVGSHHEGQTCEERQREELDILCQFCPGCEVPTVRTEGCDHIICVCGEDWTWQEVPEAGQALGPPRYLQEAIANGTLDPNWADDDEGKTCLMYVANEGRMENLKILLEAGADVHAKDHNDRTVLLYAFGIEGSFNEDVVEALVDAGAKMTKEDVVKFIKVANCARNAFERMVKLSGAALDEEIDGHPLLYYALRHGRTAQVTYLMDKLTKIDALAPFWFVMSTNNISDMDLFDKVLAASCSDVNIRDSVDKSLAMRAAEQRRTEIIKHLVSQHKAEVAFVDIARPAGFWSHQVVIPKDILDVMLEEKIDLWAESKGGGDASRGRVFEMALKCGNLNGSGTTQRKARECLETILANWGPNADLYAKTKQGADILAKACELQQWDSVQRLISGGARPEGRSEGCTSLYWAVEHKNQEVVESLIRANADVLAPRTQQSSKGQTPLELAEKSNWEAGHQLLLAEQARAAEKAAISGDGTIDNVGIKLGGMVQCPDCNQKFDTERAQQTHWRFIHDPKRHQED